MSLNTYACFYNGPYLGGAERSFSLQCRDIKNLNSEIHFRFYIPYFDKVEEALALRNFILECGFKNNDIFYYQYSSCLYHTSRTQGLRDYFDLFKMMIGLLATVKSFSRLNIQASKQWWVGGNKVGFVLLIYGLLKGFNGRFIWHFRDYPFSSGIFKVLPLLFKIPFRFKMEALANSYDVEKAIKRSQYKFSRITTLYNPVQKFNLREVNNHELIIGTASMLAPWKGVHSIILFALMYEEELRSLGYKALTIFGDDIYKTRGDHCNYKESLHQLCDSFKSDFIQFKGLVEPVALFKSIDVFIHSSLEPEPFGRVILEAFEAGTVVVSTGLGGAKELITDGVNGLSYMPYDNEGFLRCLEEASKEKRFALIQKGKERASAINKLYYDQLEGWLNP